MENSEYLDYQNAVRTVSSAMTTLAEVCGSLNMNQSVADLSSSQRQLADHHFSVGILGEFKRGKSTVINSLLGKEIMPTDILPCSATMNRVTYDIEPRAELAMRDGSVRNIPIDQLSEYVTKLTEESSIQAASIDEAIVYYPCRFCQNGVDIVDTPGLNDDDRMNKITEEVVPKLDVVIMILVPDVPFSISEAEFVRNNLMVSDLSRILFLVNKFDTIRRAADRQRVLETIQSRIQETVLDKMQEVYSDKPAQYEAVKGKLSGIRVFPLSAVTALDGKMAGDEKMVQESGAVAFEAELTRMLTEERGALELSKPLSIICRTAIEANKQIETHQYAFRLDTERFISMKDELLTSMKKLRGEKTQEIKALKERESRTKRELSTDVNRFFNGLGKALYEKLEGVRIDVRSLSNEKGQQEYCEVLKTVLSTEMEHELSVFCQKEQDKLRDVIEAEAVIVGEFTSAVNEQLSTVIDKITGGSANAGQSVFVTATALDVATDFLGIYGIGGLIAGYKQAGMKGAIVGGGIGLAANLAVAALLASVSVVGIPMLIISCASGTAVSKFVTRKIFGKSIGEKTRTEILSNLNNLMEDIISNMRDDTSDNSLQAWVDNLVGKRYADVMEAMEKDCERILSETEGTISSIQIELTNNSAQQALKEKEYEAMRAKCDKALENIQPILKRIGNVFLKNDNAVVAQP